MQATCQHHVQKRPGESLCDHCKDRYTRADRIFLFELHFALGGKRLTIQAFEAPRYDEKGEPTGGRFGHTRIEILARHGRRTIFPIGALYVGIPSGQSIDGTYAREAVASCVAMRPGDTEEEYFADYTEGQREWSEQWGEELSCMANVRYCDEYGNVKGDRR